MQKWKQMFDENSSTRDESTAQCGYEHDPNVLPSFYDVVFAHYRIALDYPFC